MKMAKVFCSACNAERRIKTTTRRGSRIDHLLECGHKFVRLSLHDSIKAYDLLGVKKKGKDSFSKDHRWNHEQLIGERVGRDGKPVFIHQVIDRTKNYYKKFVSQSGKVIKDLEQKLTEHKKEI